MHYDIEYKGVGLGGQKGLSIIEGPHVRRAHNDT